MLSGPGECRTFAPAGAKQAVSEDRSLVLILIPIGGVSEFNGIPENSGQKKPALVRTCRLAKAL